MCASIVSRVFVSLDAGHVSLQQRELISDERTKSLADKLPMALKCSEYLSMS